MLLAGDIGGTKTVIAEVGDRGEMLREQTFQAKDYDSLEAILRAYLVDARVSRACFGVAGPVSDGIAKITNLPWTIDARSLGAMLGAEVALINDLQATALGHLDATAWEVLQDGPSPEHATIAVIAPGTGLGESTLVSDGRTYRALPSEGGHADFAPTTEAEIELLRFLRARHGEHVSYERVLCGAGIGDLYDFVRGTVAAPAWIDDGDRNAAITKAALDDRDPHCVRALEMFVEVLGAEAGNLALRGLATGGVSIGGGIPPKILPALKQRRFVERLTAKGRFSTWARGLRVRVCLEPKAALFGAARYAKTA